MAMEAAATRTAHMAKPGEERERELADRVRTSEAKLWA